MSDLSINEIPETPPAEIPETPPVEIPETPPRTPIQEYQEYNPWASRDRHQKILLMTDLGYSQRAIASYLDTFRHVVQYTQKIQHATPQKPKGRPPKLTEDQLDEVIEFISISKQNRRMPYYRVIDVLNLDISTHCLRNSLNRRGYRRCIALRKPPISEATRLKRIQFACDYVNWMPTQWAQVLFTDETWVNGINHRKIYVTRRPGEELDSTYIREQTQMPRG